MSSPVFVIGHKNPDTDAICAALGYAEYLRQTRLPEAQAACCGVINARTRWVLDQAGLEPPPLLMDVRPTAATICRRDVVFARPEDSFLDVYRYLIERNFTSLPVVGPDGRLVGALNVHDLLRAGVV